MSNGIRKAVRLVAAVAVAAGLWSSRALAADIWVDGAGVPFTVHPGEEFDVGVVAEVTSQFLGEYYLPLDYDRNLVTLTRVRKGDDPQFISPIAEDVADSSRLEVWDESTRSPGCLSTGTITLVYLTFRVRDDALPLAATVIELHNNAALISCQGDTITLPPYPWGHVQITIAALPAGAGGVSKFMDLTFDGDATELDAIQLHKIVERDIQSSDAGLLGDNGRQCDVRGNGLTDLYDAGRMDALTRPARQINAGPNGVCESPALGDDVQAVPRDQGEPNSVAVAPGFNWLRDSTPCSAYSPCDDVAAVNQVLTGPDGISQTWAAGDDVQVLAYTKGHPFGGCILPGINQIITSTALGDDQQVSDDKPLAAMMALADEPGVPAQLALKAPAQNPAFLIAPGPVPITVAVLDQNGRPKTGISPVFTVIQGGGKLEDGSSTGSNVVSNLESDVYGHKESAARGEVTVIFNPAVGPNSVLIALPGDSAKGIPPATPITLAVQVLNSSDANPNLITVTPNGTATGLGQPLPVTVTVTQGGAPVHGVADRIAMITRRNAAAGVNWNDPDQGQGQVVFRDDFETGNFNGGAQGPWTLIPGNGQLLVNTVRPGPMGQFSVSARDGAGAPPQIFRAIPTTGFRDISVSYQWAFMAHATQPSYNVHFIAEYSTNGSTWRMLKDVTGYDDLLGGTGLWKTETFNLSGVDAIANAVIWVRFTFDVGVLGTYPQFLYLDNVAVTGRRVLLAEGFESYQDGDFPAALDPTNFISTGPDGILDSTTAGDDVALFSLGNGEPLATIIQTGPDLTLETTPAGDDQIGSGPSINAGPNGRADTTAASSDFQEIPYGKGKPYTRAIQPGGDNLITSTRAGDDQLIGPTGADPRVAVDTTVFPFTGGGQGNGGSGKFLFIGRSQDGSAVEPYHVGLELDLAAYDRVTLLFYAKTTSQVDTARSLIQPAQEFAVEVSDNGGQSWVRVWDNAGVEENDWTRHELELGSDGRFSLTDDFLIRWYATMDGRENSALDRDGVYLDDILLTAILPAPDKFSPLMDTMDGQGHYTTALTSYVPGSPIYLSAAYWPTDIDPMQGKKIIWSPTASPVQVLMRKAEPGSIQVLPATFTLMACESLPVTVVGRFTDTPPGKIEDMTDLFYLRVNGPARQTAAGVITADCFAGNTSRPINVYAVPRVDGLYDPGGGGGGVQTGDVSGKIYKPNYSAANLAPIWIDRGGGNKIYAHTDGNGNFLFAGVPVGTSYSLQSSLQGYTRNSKTINVTAGTNTSASIVLLSGANFDADGSQDTLDTDDDGDAVSDSSEGAGSAFDPDTDGDGYSDNADAFPNNSTEYLDSDSDGTGDNADTNDDNDGILDTEESSVGSDGYITDPKDADTDNGGEIDGNETAGGRNPTNPADDWSTADDDGDGIGNSLETSTGTNPSDPDSDDDGLCDGDTFVGVTCDAGEDLDKDGVLDSSETDPRDADSDNDGLNDLEESTSCADPRDPDTDGDGLCDGDTHVLDGATVLCLKGEDLDTDTVLDPSETDPCDDDSDNDAIPDGYEKTYNLDPRANDAAADLDLDLLTNIAEYGNSTQADAWDTDSDGLPDGFEVQNASGHTVGEELDPLAAADGAENFDGDSMENAHEYWNGTALWVDDPNPQAGYDIGCYYWGKSDGGPFVQPADITKMQTAYVGGSMDYSQIIPQAYDPMDLDRSAYADPGDIVLAQAMYVGQNRPSGYGSTPASLTVSYEPGATAVAVGDTAHVILSVHAQGPGSVLHSPGFGVVFWVSSGSATLFGGEGSDPGEASGNRYDVSGEAADGAPARVVVRVDGAGPIVISAKIPACGTEPNGRWMGEVLLGDTIVINP